MHNIGRIKNRNIEVLEVLIMRRESFEDLLNHQSIAEWLK
jgi:hypothetical protein